MNDVLTLASLLCMLIACSTHTHTSPFEFTILRIREEVGVLGF